MFARISKQWSSAVVFAFGIGMLCAVFSTTGSAQAGWDKKTMVTFNVPVEIPGVGAQILPAGTYVFRLLDSPGDRHVVQIFNKDESHLYANVLAVPNYRRRATDKTVMTFSERAAGEPLAIRAWFYPGDTSGQEFVYPKKRAVELAKITNVPVLYIPEEIAPNIVAEIPPTAPPVIVLKEAPIVALREAPIMAVTPAGVDIPLAAVVEPPPVLIASVLPKTASPLPFLALMGFLSFCAGISLRQLCAR